MNKEVKQISEKLCKSKTILLPETLDSNCYAVYSKEEYKKCDKKLLVSGKAYKHRLYFYKKLNNNSNKILTFILLNPGYSNHIRKNSLIEKCSQIALYNEYSSIEIFSIFTLRTIDKIDSVSENAILDAFRADMSKNDIVLAYGDKLKRSKKYQNVTNEDLRKINKVRQIKIDTFLDFIFNQQNRKGKIYAIGLTKSNNPKCVNSYKGNPLIEINSKLLK